MSKILTIALPLLLTTACALHPLPETGIDATGEPLGVNIETKTYTYKEKEKVGTVETRSRYGTTTSDVYAERTKVGSYKVWRPMQGALPIDEQDFYQIAGDIERAEAIRAERAEAEKYAKIGIYGGAALVAAGLITTYASLMAPSDQPFTGPSPLLYVGSGVSLIGGLGIYAGTYFNGKLSREHRFTTSDQAVRAAHQYNKELPEPEPAPSAPISRYRVLRNQ